MKTPKFVNVVYDSVLNSLTFQVSYQGKIWNFFYRESVEHSISKSLKNAIKYVTDLEHFEPASSSSALKHRLVNDSWLHHYFVRIIKLYQLSKKDINFIAEFVDSSRHFCIDSITNKFTVNEKEND